MLVRGAIQSVIAELENPPALDAEADWFRKLTTLTAIAGAVLALFSGWFVVWGRAGGSRTRSRADMDAVHRGHATVDAWERKFGLPSTRTGIS